MLIWPVVLTTDENGTMLVTSPDLPEVTTFGENREDALHHAAHAIEEAIAARIDHYRDLPQPSGGLAGAGLAFVGIPTLSAIKAMLHIACRDIGVSRAELARRLGWHREQVDRLFRLDHASKLDAMDAAFRAVGRRLDVEVRPAA